VPPRNTRAGLKKLDLESPKLPEDLAQLARAGNETALQAWNAFGKALACGIGSLANTLGIFNFVVGGGLSGAWDLFSEACRAEISNWVYATSAQKIQLVAAQLGERAGLVGGIPLIQHYGNGK